jgi:hypothetical protein
MRANAGITSLDKLTPIIATPFTSTYKQITSNDYMENKLP